MALQYASEDLRADAEVVAAAVSQNGLALQFASGNLKNNKEIVKAAIQNNYFAVGFASAELRADEEIVSACNAAELAEDVGSFMRRSMQDSMREALDEAEGGKKEAAPRLTA